MAFKIRQFRPSASPAVPCANDRKPVRNLSAFAPNLSAVRLAKNERRKSKLEISINL